MVACPVFGFFLLNTEVYRTNPQSHLKPKHSSTCRTISNPVAITVTQKLRCDFSALPSPWRIVLHRTEIVDRCPMQFLVTSSRFVLALSCATNLTCYTLFDIAGFLLRFLGSLLSLPAEDLAVFSFFPWNNYIIT